MDEGSISWNEQAEQQAQDQGVAVRDVMCSKCGMRPALRQFARYSCECGEIQGFTSRGLLG
jgi:hypothetical protein